MMISKRIQWGEILLFFTLFLGVCFGYWLMAESDDEKVRRIFLAHDQLVLQGKRLEARALFKDSLKVEGDGALDPVWIPFVRVQGNGYVQLEFYLRILAGDPDRELTYQEIANLVDMAPEVFHLEVKSRYFFSFAQVSGARPKLLESYGLKNQ